MHRSKAAVAALLLLALHVAAPRAAAHSELVASDPADGAVLVAPPAGVVADFTEPVDPGRSSLELRGPDGGRIATGGVPSGGPATRMTIAGLAGLAPGAYEVRWTTVTPDDGGVERGTVRFTVAEPTPVPPTPTAEPPPTPSLAPIGSPSPSPTSPSPGPSAGPEPQAGTGIADLALPLVVLVALVAAGAAILLRRRR